MERHREWPSPPLEDEIGQQLRRGVSSATRQRAEQQRHPRGVSSASSKKVARQQRPLWGVGHACSRKVAEQQPAWTGSSSAGGRRDGRGRNECQEPPLWQRGSSATAEDAIEGIGTV